MIRHYITFRRFQIKYYKPGNLSAGVKRDFRERIVTHFLTTILITFLEYHPTSAQTRTSVRSRHAEHEQNENTDQSCKKEIKTKYVRRYKYILYYYVYFVI